MENAALIDSDVIGDELAVVTQALSEAAQTRDDFNVSRIEIGTRMAARGQFAAALRGAKISSTKRMASSSGISKEYIHKLHKLALLRVARVRPAVEMIGSGRSTPIAPRMMPLSISVQDLAAEQNLIFDLPAPTPERQHSLPLAGDFSPSLKLVEFWVRGVESYRPTNAYRSPCEAAQVTPKIRHEFAKMLQSIISTVAQQRRYSRDRTATLTSGGRFPTILQTEICDRFQIVPDESRDFLSLLFIELRSAVAEGARFDGGWGKLELTSASDLVFALNEPTVVEERGFVMSEDVE
ncbi:hypothetical protein F8B43_5058 [Methylorubrum populi]|uniref:Uncharacterized protein n=2 Tax=Methylorubrum populi TaxID=223967 RepID=A0A833J0K7_9HYPH|nr:hypothetical protein F8B43_5058 [Methylorubrum populi]